MSNAPVDITRSGAADRAELKPLISIRIFGLGSIAEAQDAKQYIYAYCGQHPWHSLFGWLKFGEVRYEHLPTGDRKDGADWYSTISPTTSEEIEKTGVSGRALNIIADIVDEIKRLISIGALAAESVRGIERTGWIETLIHLISQSLPMIRRLTPRSELC